MRVFIFCFVFLNVILTRAYAQIEVPEQSVLMGQLAMEIARKAFNEAINKGYSVSVTLVDKSGQTLVVLRHHDAGVHTLRASYKKAFTVNTQKKGLMK